MRENLPLFPSLFLSWFVEELYIGIKRHGRGMKDELGEFETTHYTIDYADGRIRNS